MRFTRLPAMAPLSARAQIVQIQEVQIDYLPGLALDEKKPVAVGCKIFIYMAHF